MAKDTNGKRSPAEESYTRLHQAIVQGQLLPNERLVELDLAERFESGRADIRTALARLAQEGLVEREPNRGARVRAVSEAEAVEIYEARSVLEGLVARYAARNATKLDIVKLRAIHTQMQQCHKKGDLLGMSDLNAQLHAELLRIAAHQTATRLIERLRAQNVRFQYRTILVPGRADRSLAEHRAIVDAVAAHDEDAAEEAIRAHITNVVEALRQSARTKSFV
jgi:DNA-binding GntR family transcriptional regulator